MRKIIAKIHLKNICRNAERFRSLYGNGNRLCAVVKANAYGHGAEEVAFALSSIADCFAVALLDEAIALRVAACGRDILILTPPLTEWDVLCAAQNGFLLSVCDFLTARLVLAVCEKYRIPVRVHLKTNTGMNRYGMDLPTLKMVCKLFYGNKNVHVEGVYSHLYTTDRAISKRQRELFLAHVGEVKGYFPNALCHLSATYGATLGNEFLFDMQRVGLGLYGYFPDGIKPPFPLEKGMEIFAQTIQTRKYTFGGAGYGQAQKIDGGEELSVVRYGYADGFLRQRENGLNGDKLHINRLCMDACIRKERLEKGTWIPVMTDAAYTAARTGTIAYEVLCAATRRAEFVYDYE